MAGGETILCVRRAAQEAAGQRLARICLGCACSCGSAHCCCRASCAAAPACILTPLQDIGPLSASLPPKKFFGRFALALAVEAPGVCFLLLELLRCLQLPPLSTLLYRFDPEFLEDRRKGLDACVHARAAFARRRRDVEVLAGTSSKLWSSQVLRS